MANYVLTQNTGVAILERLENAYKLWTDYRAKRRLFATTRRELMALTPRELADIGITRSEIYGIAYSAAYEDAR